MSKQKDRLTELAASVQTLLGTNYNLVIVEVEKADYLLSLDQTARLNQDPQSFNLYYKAKTIKKLSDETLKRHLTHEMIHAICWKLTTVFNKALAHVPDETLRTELKTLFREADESMTYELERSFGKTLYPSADWD